MAGEKPLSSLFGDMQGTPSGSTPASTPLPDKKVDLLGTLENVSEVIASSPASEPIAPPVAQSTGLFSDVVPEKIETVGETSETLPEVEILSTSSPSISPISSETSPDTAQTPTENIEIIGTTLPEIDTPIQSESLLSGSGVPVVESEVLPIMSENVSLSEGVIPPPETSDIPDVSLSEVKTESISSPVSEIVPTPTVLPESPESKNNNEEPKTETEDPKMAHYLRADAVYQEMLKVEDQEKIRLRLAVRYTLLMFAIFLVFAWIVSNRVIMLGFSEFVWLARIRDALFAIMAGLFSLTLWFGSVSWMRQIYLISLLRTLAIVLFVMVLFALYLPF